MTTQLRWAKTTLAGILLATAVPVFAAGISIKSLSTHPDTVTGGDALIGVDVPSDVALDQVVVKLNGADVTPAFHSNAATRTLTGLVTGMNNGANALAVYTNSGALGTPADQLTLINHPLTGPVVSGPQQQPFFCQTQTFRLPDGTFLGPATDPATCSVPTRVDYVYRSTAGGALRPMTSTTSLPSDVAMTTTDAGVTVPFVVRVETGTMARGIYQNAVLHDPTTEAAPTPFAPPKAWNKRLQGLHGTGCNGGWYIQGSAMGENILDPVLLGRGFGMFINSLNHPSNSCNAVLAGEVTMMGKEHWIETFGVPYYTVSRGCSGGSYTSEQVADAFPGLVDGILIDCTFPDAMSIALSGQDGHLLTHYFAVTNPTGFTPAQQAAVSGYANTTTLLAAANQSQRTDPISGRVDVPGYTPGTFASIVPASVRYNPTTNPTGARATVFDENANVYGRDPATGFALRTFDNVGVQYGLAALNKGQITTTQFLDLNEKIGGYDQDENYVPTRTTGDIGAIKRMQQSGVVLGGNGGLASIPIFDFTGIYSEDTTNYHLQWEHFATRERLIEANGNAANEVMWRADPAVFALDNAARVVFDQWMEAYKADTSNLSQREKVIRDKPAQAVDGCWSSPTTFIAEPQTFSSTPNTTCNALLPSFGFPRLASGGPLAANKYKCQLKPITASDYTVQFSSAELARLQAIFPTGVCDWSKPGVNQTGVLPWPTVPATGQVALSACVDSPQAAANGTCLPPVDVLMVPDTLNLRTTAGLVTAVLTLPQGYDLTQWTVNNVKLGSASALSSGLSADAATFVLVFNKRDLASLPAGSSTLSVTGNMAKNGNQGTFTASTRVNVLR